MKIIAYLILVLLTPFSVLSQIEAKAINFENRLEVVLEKDTLSNTFTEKIHSVNVIDARDETEALGFHYLKPGDAIRYGIKPVNSKKSKNEDSWSKVYHCSPSLKEEFTGWVSTYLQCKGYASAAHTLLIVVKKFWLTESADKIKFDNDKTGQAINGWDAGVVCKLEFYLEKDSIFYPLYRIDSVFTYKDRLNDYAGVKFVDNAGLFVRWALKASLEKLADIDLQEVSAKRRKLAFTDIYREYSKKTEIPVLNIGSYKKGVYKDFEEFRTNSPSITDYEFRKGKAGDILFVKEGTSEYPTRNAWGFCDGEDIFINSGDKYSKLVRKGNTFYFFGTKGAKQNTKHDFWKSSGLNYISGYGPKKTVYVMDLKYYQIDMETGEVY